VKTSRARNKIKHVISTTERAKAIDIGEKLLEKEARRLGVQLSKVTKSELERVAAEYGYSKIEELHAALGYGKFSPRQVLQKAVPGLLQPEPQPEPPRPAAQAAGPVAAGEHPDLVIKVKGADDLLVYRAKCCNPIRGEKIVGYITRGKGVAVHSAACPNVQNLFYEAERKIDVEWARSAHEAFAVRIVVYTDDRPGMLNQITSILFKEDCNIRTLEARPDDGKGNEGAVVEMTVEIRDKKQLERISSAIRRLSGVRDIERVQ